MLATHEEKEKVDTQPELYRWRAVKHEVTRKTRWNMSSSMWERNIREGAGGRERREDGKKARKGGWKEQERWEKGRERKNSRKAYAERIMLKVLYNDMVKRSRRDQRGKCD